MYSHKKWQTGLNIDLVCGHLIFKSIFFPQSHCVILIFTCIFQGNKHCDRVNEIDQPDAQKLTVHLKLSLVYLTISFQTSGGGDRTNFFLKKHRHSHHYVYWANDSTLISFALPGIPSFDTCLNRTLFGTRAFPYVGECSWFREKLVWDLRCTAILRQQNDSNRLRIQRYFTQRDEISMSDGKRKALLFSDLPLLGDCLHERAKGWTVSCQVFQGAVSVIQRKRKNVKTWIFCPSHCAH